MSDGHKDKKLEPIGSREPIVDPDRRIVDAHHHLWPRYRVFGYLPSEYLEDAATHRVEASIFAECMASYDREAPEHLKPVGETKYIVRECPPPSEDGKPFIGAGIVGRVDLSLDASLVREALEAQVAVGQGRFKGIRYSTIAWHEPDVLPGMRRNTPGVMRTERFRAAFAELAGMSLTFDAWLTYLQLDELTELADRFPDADIVIDHFGGVINPSRTEAGRHEAFDIWRAAIEEIAQRPKVHMKLGGVGMPVFGFGYEEMAGQPSSDRIAADWSPYLKVCLEAFGPERCMFESNFSPDKAGVTFHNLWNAFKKMTSACSEAEKEQLFSGTAERVYSLAPSPQARQGRHLSLTEGR
jgi:predicted TIM-barrel fold metal-dependent hydrolase